MAQPSVNEVHVDSILTNVSIAYMQDQANFIASRVFPVIPVDKMSDKYFVYTKNDWFRDEAQRRGPNQESAGSGYNIGTDNYSAQVFAFHKDVSNQLIQNADAPLNPEREAARFVASRLLLRQEIQWVSDYFTTGVWATDVTPANLWSDYAASDPIGDIETGKEGILSVTGYEPNTLVLGYQVFRQLKNHPDVIDRFKYTSANNITADMLARLFEVDRLLVAKSIKATNLEGETAAYSFVHGKHALLCYSNPSPELLAPSAGYTFYWKGVSEGLGANIGTKSFPMVHLESQRVESQLAWDNKVVATDLGYFFNGAVA